ncbi:MFS transporter [Aquirhabdus sp.]|uniref:MFS transporter n=1 Tax=Aquirhabdus sp. TaxID=2824160 RepID=UPI00396CF5E3
MNVSELRATFALGSIFALRMLGLFMIVPVFAIYGQGYTGATPALIGLAIGVYGLSQAILQIPVSLLADRTARKPLIVIGLLIFALGGAIAAMSTSIWGVILGRAIAGAGAISAVVMALLADVTREQHRSKAMAAMGMSIGLSFIIAFSLGPFLTKHVGLSGLFWLTSIAGILAIGLLAVVPSPLRLLKQNPLGFGVQLKSVLVLPDLNRLHVSIFALHLVMTAAFVMLPQQLVRYAHIPVEEHGWLYLPLLLLGAVMTIPAIIVAEVKRRMRRIFIGSVALVVMSLAVLTADHTRVGLLLGLGLFFIAFNLLEAMIPSWLAKRAPAAAKATAMGINASSQFLGAFAGGVLGGQLLTFATPQLSWAILAAIALVWFLIIVGLNSPPYLSSLSIRLPEFPHGTQHVNAKMNDWAACLLEVGGVEDVVVLPDQHVAYLKVDKKKMSDTSREQLSQLVGQPVVF